MSAGASPAPRPLLELDRVRKQYGALTAVDDVSMTVHEGECRALIGPNGAGKTTLFNLIGGVMRPTSGTITFDGRDITRMPEHRRARIGLAKTFQHSNLFDGLTAHENVATAVRHHAGVAHRVLRPASGYRDVIDRAHELLAQVGIGERAQTTAGKLSHGERRQLEVAVALAIEPKLLLLDEPVAGMSQGEGENFVAMVGQLPEPLTVVVIEHDMDVVFALADHISVMDAGEILAEGDPAAVRGNAEVQAAYLGAGGSAVFVTDDSPHDATSTSGA